MGIKKGVIESLLPCFNYGEGITVINKYPYCLICNILHLSGGKASFSSNKLFFKLFFKWTRGITDCLKILKADNSFPD